MYEAVICDWDGTLADTRKAIVISFQKALKEISLEVPAEFVERRMGIGAAETFREILAAANRRVDEKIVKQLVERKSKMETESQNILVFRFANGILSPSGTATTLTTSRSPRRRRWASKAAGRLREGWRPARRGAEPHDGAAQFRHHGTAFKL